MTTIDAPGEAHYTVGEVAAISGVTIRTLHHYDEIGLLDPAQRSASGYRQYSAADLERLQEILFYRELGFSLDDIRTALEEPGHDRLTALQTQRELLFSRLGRVERLIASIDGAIEAHRTGVTMNREEMFEVFGDFDPDQHTAEVEARWGGEQLEESRRRTASYGKQQWREIKQEGDDILARFAHAKRAGESPDGSAATDLAEEHRRHIDRWFYPCSPSQHANLGELYVTDPRFTAYWDDAEPGLAEYVRQAIVANAVNA